MTRFEHIINKTSRRQATQAVFHMQAHHVLCYNKILSFEDEVFIIIFDRNERRVINSD